MLVVWDSAVGITQLLLAHILWQSMIEVFIGEHIAISVDWTKHYVLGHLDLVLVMEDKDRIALHVNGHDIVNEELESIVKVDHAELGH